MLQTNRQTDRQTHSQLQLDEIHRLVAKAPTKHCELDPLPTWLLKQVIDQLAPVLALMCNASQMTGKFPSAEKHALMSARLTKPDIHNLSLKSTLPLIQQSPKPSPVRLVRSSLPNFTLIGPTCRPCGAKNRKNRFVSKNNTGRAAHNDVKLECLLRDRSYVGIVLIFRSDVTRMCCA